MVGDLKDISIIKGRKFRTRNIARNNLGANCLGVDTVHLNALHVWMAITS